MIDEIIPVDLRVFSEEKNGGFLEPSPGSLLDLVLPYVQRNILGLEACLEQQCTCLVSAKA
jgi:hypothetical protein